MNLYTDDNPHTTLTGLGFKNKAKALFTINKVEKHFCQMFEQQKIPGWTPINVLPRTYLQDVDQSVDYYEKQKMYRILGMLNRAKGMLNKVKNKDKLQDIKQAIEVFRNWMLSYQN